MTVSSFQKQVRLYSHLPRVFLLELAKAATRIPDEQRQEIVAELDASAKREVSILAKGYKLLSTVEKKVRKAAEAVEHTKEEKKANFLIK
jgi:hypothetical protein